MFFRGKYLRSLICTKYDDSKLLYIITFVMFIMLDLINLFKPMSLTSTEGIFYFVATILLPIISNNITANYIAKVSNYKVNMYWLLILNLYVYVLPIIPNTGDYVLSVIRLIFPLVIYFRVRRFFKKEADEDIIREYNKKTFLPVVIASFFIIILVYFTSGYFRFYAVAIASGSMRPEIHRGDVVVIDQNYNDIKIGQVIAYKYKKVMVVHRLVNKIEVDGKNYYYTKGDANASEDNYAINEEDIVGIVNFKIPYIGLPTVWLSEI